MLPNPHETVFHCTGVAQQTFTLRQQRYASFCIKFNERLHKLSPGFLKQQKVA